MLGRNRSEGLKLREQVPYLSGVRQYSGIGVVEDGLCSQKKVRTTCSVLFVHMSHTFHKCKKDSGELLIVADFGVACQQQRDTLHVVSVPVVILQGCTAASATP